jgi:hypothetical protein
LFAAARVENWKEALDVAEALAGWVFRGRGDTKWKLKTRIERDASGLGRPGFTLVDREGWVLRQFQRRAHHYLNNLPENDEVFQREFFGSTT